MPLTGTYTLLIEGRFNAAGGPTAAYTVNVQPVIDGILPVVAGGFFNPDLGPNHKVQFAFSQNVGASLAIGDFALINADTNASIPLSSVAYDNQNNIATVSVGQTLPQGNYRMRLIANGISDGFGHKLDGNADGVEGDDFLFDFFFLPGDANQDRTINFADLVALSQNYGKSGKLFSQGDFDYNGTVDFPDLVALAQRYNFTLPPAPPPGPAAPLGAVAATTGANVAVQAPAAAQTSVVAAVQPTGGGTRAGALTPGPASAPQRKPFSVSRISHEVIDVPQHGKGARPKPAKRSR